MRKKKALAQAGKWSAKGQLPNRFLVLEHKSTSYANVVQTNLIRSVGSGLSLLPSFPTPQIMVAFV